MQAIRSKPRLLAVGDGGVKSGFARVTESVLSRVLDRFDVHHLACNYRGDPHGCGWDLYPAALGGDPFGIGRLPDLVRRLSPDLIWTVNDLWFQRDYLKAIFASSPDARVVAYSPVDAGPLDPEWLELMPRAKACVLYTEFGRREVLSVAPKELEGLLQVIPHGVDQGTFYPLEHLRPEEAKQKLGITRSLEEPSFVVLNANRNQPRKRIDLTLAGFAQFARGKPPGVKLLLHMGQSDLGWNVVKLGRRLGIEERLVLSGPPDGTKPSVDDESLNLVYNASDVGLNTCGGEGWGLPALEHAATRKAQILPCHSACAEIWRDAAILLPVRDRAVQPSTLTEFHYTRAEDVAAALESVYQDVELLRRVAERCYRVATRPELAWGSIAERWQELWDQALSAS